MTSLQIWMKRYTSCLSEKCREWEIIKGAVQRSQNPDSDEPTAVLTSTETLARQASEVL